MKEYLDEVEQILLDVANYIHDAIERDQPISESKTVDPLLAAHGYVLSVLDKDSEQTDGLPGD